MTTYINTTYTNTKNIIDQLNNALAADSNWAVDIHDGTEGRLTAHHVTNANTYFTFYYVENIYVADTSKRGMIYMYGHTGYGAGDDKATQPGYNGTVYKALAPMVNDVTGGDLRIVIADDGVVVVAYRGKTRTYSFVFGNTETSYKIPFISAGTSSRYSTDSSHRFKDDVDFPLQFTNTLRDGISRFTNNLAEEVTCQQLYYKGAWSGTVYHRLIPPYSASTMDNKDLDAPSTTSDYIGFGASLINHSRHNVRGNATLFDSNVFVRDYTHPNGQNTKLFIGKITSIKAANLPTYITGDVINVGADQYVVIKLMEEAPTIDATYRDQALCVKIN